MENQEKLATYGTQDTRRGRTKQNTKENMLDTIMRKKPLSIRHELSYN